ncbi:MAG TPA: hypothetical protein VGT60_06935 [Candidatus Limnocylindria bacterium]|nr:hypothetical protein [Candidatus Limnocylindria bacterium]
MSKTVDADLIPIAPTLPVLADGRYVWPVGRVFRGEIFPSGSLFLTEGDCWTCSRCGVANSTIAPFCTNCRALLPLGSSKPETVTA